MKIYLILLLINLSFSVSAQERFLDVVFDLDWTLLYPIKDPSKVKPEKLIEADGGYYRVADWTEEVLTQLSERPDVRISFYSGGSIIRNIEALKKIKLASGKSAFDIAFKILNNADLFTVSDDQSLPFNQRFKKDLTRINSNISLVILVDDSKNFTMPGQEAHQLWLGKTYNFYEIAEDLPLERGAYDPKTISEWRRERNKMLSIYESIMKVYNKKETLIPIEFLPLELPAAKTCDWPFY
ncbi:MAG: hypothetical protein ACOYL6_01975 [Bacteriovoracaceae bacterium]